MLFTFGAEDILKTLLTLTENRSNGSSVELKSAYLNFLRSVQSRVPIAGESSPALIEDAADLDFLYRVFNSNSPFHDMPHTLNQSTPAYGQQKSIVLARANEAVDRIATFRPEFREVYNLFVTGFFLSPCLTAAGGTSSKSIGTVWISGRENWHANDYQEFHIHELAHTLLFLDEHRHVHYLDSDAMLRPENYPVSAIFYRLRPIDKVVHSIVIATDILLARETGLGHRDLDLFHPKTKILAVQTLNSIASVRLIPDYDRIVAPRVEALLARCREVTEVFL